MSPATSRTNERTDFRTAYHVNVSRQFSSGSITLVNGTGNLRMKTYAIVLGILGAAFFGRVVGQVLVALFHPSVLPPMEEWYSGLIPYPILLPMQMVIVAFQMEMSHQLWIEKGELTRQRPRLGTTLKWFSLIYFIGMVTRYAVSMSAHPERRWFGGTIPIFFHWVLAAYLYLLSRYHRDLPVRLTGGEKP